MGLCAKEKVSRWRRHWRNLGFRLKVPLSYSKTRLIADIFCGLVKSPPPELHYLFCISVFRNWAHLGGWMPLGATSPSSRLFSSHFMAVCCLWSSWLRSHLMTSSKWWRPEFVLHTSVQDFVVVLFCLRGMLCLILAWPGLISLCYDKWRESLYGKCTFCQLWSSVLVKDAREPPGWSLYWRPLSIKRRDAPWVNRALFYFGCSKALA